MKCVAVWHIKLKYNVLCGTLSTECCSAISTRYKTFDMTGKFCVRMEQFKDFFRVFTCRWAASVNQ